MDSRKVSTYEMLARVAAFGVTHADLFPQGSLPGDAFAAIGRGIRTIAEQAALQVSNGAAARIKSRTRSAARWALQKWLDRISQTADAIGIDLPELQGKFREPKERRDFNLVSAGHSFAAGAEPLKDHFIQHRMPPDFIDSVKAAAANLERSMLEQAAGKEKRANAAREIDGILSDCLSQLQRVDAVVRNTLQDQPAIMAEWNVTRRVRKPAVRSADAEPENGSTADQTAETPDGSAASGPTNEQAQP